MTRYPEPFDRTYNAAVVHLAALKWPRGWFASIEAPSTLAELIEDQARHYKGLRIRVSSEASDHTIYGDPEVNHAFRAWHDYWHWRKGLPFDIDGEYRAFLYQRQDLLDTFPDNYRTHSWIRLLEAEVIGNGAYLALWGRFPEDQRAFTREYLVNPTKALSSDYRLSNGGLANA